MGFVPLLRDWLFYLARAHVHYTAQPAITTYIIYLISFITSMQLDNYCESLFFISNFITDADGRSLYIVVVEELWPILSQSQRTGIPLSHANQQNKEEKPSKRGYASSPTVHCCKQ